MALALNNLKRVDMPLNKETKPRKIPRSLEKLKLKLINSFPSSLTKLVWIITSCLNMHSSKYIHIYGKGFYIYIYVYIYIYIYICILIKKIIIPN